MADLYGRRTAIEIGDPGSVGRRFDGLRITFSIRRSSTASPDAAEVAVYNPGAETVAALESPRAVVRVIAGYDAPAVVLSGRIVLGSLRVERDGPSRVARLQVQDGGLDLRQTRLSRAWGGTVYGSEILDYVLEASGLARGTIRLPVDPTYARGTVTVGALRDTVATVARDAGASWAVQDGALHVWPAAEERNRTAILLSPSTGLIGSPVLSDDGHVEVVSLLRPTLRPGDVYAVRAELHSGEYVAVDVEHRGDSHGTDYYTTITGRRRG